MRKLWTGLVIFILMAVFLAVISVQYAKSYGYSGLTRFAFYGKASLRNTQEFSVDQIENIDMEYSSENVEFKKSDNSKIVIREYLYSGDEKRHALMEVEGDTLYVRKSGGKSRNTIFILGLFSNNERIEVYLPEDYCDNVNVTTSSGNIRMDSEWNFKELDISAKSGNISGGEIEAESITAEASSGNITFDRMDGNRRISTSSGNINLSAGEGDTDASASSGNIKIKEARGKMKASANSGNIKLELNGVTGDMTVSTTSGNINMEIPEDSSFSYEGSAASGTIKTDFDEVLSFNKKGNKASGSYGGNSLFRIKTDTSSGNATLRFR